MDQAIPLQDIHHWFTNTRHQRKAKNCHWNLSIELQQKFLNIPNRLGRFRIWEKSQGKFLREMYSDDTETDKVVSFEDYVASCPACWIFMSISKSQFILFFRLVFQNVSFFKIKTYIKVKQKMLHHPNRKNIIYLFTLKFF